MIVFYESSSITTEICNSIYIADQRQDYPQEYDFPTPNYITNNPFLFSVFSSRITSFESDKAELQINNASIGEIWTPDIVSSTSSTGVQGHFFYENGIAEGLNGDTANSVLLRHDGIADVREYLNPFGINTLSFIRPDVNTVDINPVTYGGNLFPAFTITYVPDCSEVIDLSNFNQEYAFCRGDTIQLTTTSAYDNFSWSTSTGLSDTTLSNPLCFADTSQWYTVTMWNEDEEGCGQTIPVFVEINDIPVPSSLTVRTSLCPANTGEIIANGTPGNLPITYSLSGTENTSGVFENLAPGIYDLNITTATGCVWDTTVVILMNPVQEASFTTTPESGFSPLDVFFANTSTQATNYQWLIDGVPISTSEDITYTFPDSGSFTVSLIAFRLEETCADTATFTLRVEPGIRVLMPNIITPNGDGRNDALVAQVQGVASCRWVIYNRWGNEVATGADDAPFQKVELWQPESDISAGQYSVVFVAEGLAGQVEKMVFEVTVVE